MALPPMLLLKTLVSSHRSLPPMDEPPAASLRIGRRRRGVADFPVLRCSSSPDDNEHHHHHPPPYPRPEEIPWSKDLANAVHLVGIVGTPVQSKHLSSGKVLAWTRLGLKNSASETTWVSLTFWDEMTHIAVQHLEKGHQVYVCGRLVSDTVEEGEKQQVYYKVVVQKLNFIERSFPPVSSYDHQSNSSSAARKPVSYAANNANSTELWQAFFANPIDWWDNRQNKKNPRSPDFKHQHTNEALWVDAKYNPSWVKSQLAILDTRMGSLQAHATNSAAVSFVRSDELSLF